MKRVAIYARVSTDKQTCENQLIELRAVAERCGYTIVTEFVEMNHHFQYVSDASLSCSIDAYCANIS
jgi:DNA invertase Pin-like site-specific DNA recombinase